MISNCNNSTLATYTPSAEKPWNIKRVKHLYRRLGFGANIATIKNALTQNPSDLIDTLIDEAVNKPIMQAPEWGYWDRDQIYEAFGDNYISESRQIMEYQFYDDMRTSCLRDRLNMFWSNHFVTQENLIKKPPYLYQQYIMRQKHAIGNFKDFVSAVGLDPSMLIYLNGIDNKAGSPNENYARELYELFTLGVDNGYTEKDIEETAKALTGYNSFETTWGTVQFDEKGTFDNEEKTIFGRTGNWGYDDVIDILFEEKAPLIARYICEEFYKYFISLSINEIIVEELAQTFLDNDFEIAPVMRQLFKSEHFFDDQSIGTIIKSPMDLIITLQNELEMSFSGSDDLDSDDYTLNRSTYLISYYLSMRVFDPPNVFGWQGGASWLNSVTFPERWMRMQHVFSNQKNNNPDDSYEVFREFAQSLFDTNETDYVKVVKGIVNHFLSVELSSDADYNDAINIFKGNVPDNYYEDGTWSLDYHTVGDQVYGLFYNYIIITPEFQIK